MALRKPPSLGPDILASKSALAARRLGGGKFKWNSSARPPPVRASMKRPCALVSVLPSCSRAAGSERKQRALCSLARGATAHDPTPKLSDPPRARFDRAKRSVRRSDSRGAQRGNG